jgi:hypothetical protein
MSDDGEESENKECKEREFSLRKKMNKDGLSVGSLVYYSVFFNKS